MIELLALNQEKVGSVPVVLTSRRKRGLSDHRIAHRAGGTLRE